MQTRRDQLQAYRFAIQRIVAALLHGEPDAAESPTRRIGIATFSSVMIGVLALVAVGVYGLLRPGGNDTWRESNKIIVEKGTATRFVFLDGVLHPVTNFASARLLLGAGAETVFVDGKSLGATPRGSTIGLVSAPDNLPAAGDLIQGPWVECTQPSSAGQGGSLVTIAVGMRPDGLTLGPTDGLLAKTPDGSTFLVWNNARLKLPDADAVATALNFNVSGQVYPVDDGWINAIPPGPDLRPIAIPDVGQPGPVISGRPTTVGQVAVINGQAGAQNQYFVVLTGELAPITETDARLLLGDRQVIERAYPGRRPSFLELSSAEVSPLRGASKHTAGFPPLLPPRLQDASLGGPQVLCASFEGVDREQVAITVTGKAPGVPDTVLAKNGSIRQIADYVAVAPNGGAFVQGMSTGNQKTAARYLISNLGVKFPIPSDDARDKLGYSGVTPSGVPNTLLDLIPQGIALDPDAARQEVSATVDPKGGR